MPKFPQLSPNPDTSINFSLITLFLPRKKHAFGKIKGTNLQGHLIATLMVASPDL